MCTQDLLRGEHVESPRRDSECSIRPGQEFCDDVLRLGLKLALHGSNASVGSILKISGHTALQDRRGSRFDSY